MGSWRSILLECFRCTVLVSGVSYWVPVDSLPGMYSYPGDWSWAPRPFPWLEGLGFQEFEYNYLACLHFVFYFDPLILPWSFSPFYLSHIIPFALHYSSLHLHLHLHIHPRHYSLYTLSILSIAIHAQSERLATQHPTSSEYE